MRLENRAADPRVPFAAFEIAMTLQNDQVGLVCHGGEDSSGLRLTPALDM